MPGSETTPIPDAFRAARRDRSLAVLEGFHPLKHALRFGAEVVRAVAVDRGEVGRMAAELAPDVAAAMDAVVGEVPRKVFERLAPRPPHTGVIALARRPVASAAELGRKAPVVLLEDPRDLANVGACVRIAAAAGAAGVAVTGDRDPWGPDALRGSAGLHFALPVLQGEPPLDGRALIALDPDGEPLRPHAIPDDAVLAFGTERSGLSDAVKQRADRVLALPMEPGVSSINLAASVSAVLYAWRLGRGD